MRYIAVANPSSDSFRVHEMTREWVQRRRLPPFRCFRDYWRSRGVSRMMDHCGEDQSRLCTEFWGTASGFSKVEGAGWRNFELQAIILVPPEIGVGERNSLG